MNNRIATFVFLIIGCGTFFFTVSTVLAVDYERLIIRNVRMIDPAEKAEDKIVAIMIEKQQLSLVTEDSIATKETDLVVDAQKGVLIGSLKLGAPPSFMIFVEDPRKDFKIMLDTNRYAAFALHEGHIYRNNLTVIENTDTEEKAKESDWLAYVPPSMAVPTNYQDSSRWNRWDNKYISGIFTGALALDRTSWPTQNAGSETLYGNLDEYEGGEIRALRFGIMGTLNFANPWVYNFTVATNAFDKGFELEDLDSLVLYDYRMDIPLSKNTTISIGKQKEPISMDRLMPMVFEPMQERAAVSDAMLPARNVGIVWSGRNADTFTTWAIGAFNDWFDTNQDFDENASQFVGRVTWVPLVSQDESNLLHLGVRYRYSDAKEGFHYRSEPEMKNFPLFVDTGLHEADRADTLNLELSWRGGLSS